MPINQIIRSLQWFVVPSLVFGLLALLFTVQYGLAETQIWFNHYYTDFLDQLMPIYTYLGDGLIFGILVIPLLFFKRRALVALLFAGVITLLLTGLTKAYFNEPRPLKVFESLDYSLREVPNVKPHYQHSFPSGHTTAAFAAWGLLAFFLKRPFAQLICFSIAAGVAYSRIYLSMHFLRDVGAGAILGTFIVIVAIYLASKLRGSWADKNWFGK